MVTNQHRNFNAINDVIIELFQDNLISYQKYVADWKSGGKVVIGTKMTIMGEIEEV
jgi:hypothetical protein